MKRTLHSNLSVHFVRNSFALLVLFLACIGVLLWRSFFTGIFWRVAAPLLQTGKIISTPLNFVSTSFSSKAALEAERAQLQSELDSTTALLADRDALYQENLDLKNRLGRDAHTQTVLAGVLLRPPGVPYDTLLIDAGSVEGLAVGDLVSAGGTTLVGTITEVHQTTSTVVLFSAPGERYNVLLLAGGSTASTTHISIPITLEGQGSGSLRAEVPAGTPAAQGDAIVSPGVVNGFVGTVSLVSKKDSESFETVFATLPVNPLQLRFVEVWK